jgi:FkbM family methyltransferase
MEGNECYKFSTIVNYIHATGTAGVRVMVDIGTNVGAISLMMKSYFPAATLYGYEPVDEYFQTALINIKTGKDIHLFKKAVTSTHLYFDDLGEKPRQKQASLVLFKGLPEAGPGFIGGSVVVPDDHAMARPGHRTAGYERMEQRVYPITLDTIWKNIHDAERVNEIDLVKIDCEGDENSVLGCAKPATLKKIRFIVGEYHDIERFYNIMRNKLFMTHKVNLIGQTELGCFFAERLDGERDGVLLYSKDGMLQPRPWLSKHPIDWHLFNTDFVPHEAWSSHSLP